MDCELKVTVIDKGKGLNKGGPKIIILVILKEELHSFLYEEIEL